LHSVEQKGDYYCRERRNQENVCGLIWGTVLECDWSYWGNSWK
jgi:hypothetical protein